jgi:hypothetical protein
MDSKAKISIDNAMDKDKQLHSLKQKLKMEDISEYLDGILISTGHHHLLVENSNQDKVIHLYFC